MKKMFSLEITTELHEMLRVEAFNQHLTISALVRKILEEYFNERTNI